MPLRVFLLLHHLTSYKEVLTQPNRLIEDIHIKLKLEMKFQSKSIRRLVTGTPISFIADHPVLIFHTF